MSLRVGQSLWYVSEERRWPRDEYVTVTKLGRKWAEISNGLRIDTESLRADGGKYSSPGRCHGDKEKYEIEQQRLKAWQNLREEVSLLYAPIAGVTLEDIQKASLLLSLKPRGSAA